MSESRDSQRPQVNLFHLFVIVLSDTSSSWKMACQEIAVQYDPDQTEIIPVSVRINLGFENYQ